MKLNLSPSLINLVQNAGAHVYVVGGYVRNAIANLGSTDVDLCGPLVATALNLPKGARVRTVNFRLGTSIINYMGEEYEYTPFRTEKYSEGGGHTPEAISFTSDIRKDAVRRDFACNSVYYDIANDKFIDFYNGISDCENGILRCYDPEKVFSNDGLRILRLVRIAAETGFKMDGLTAKTAMSRADYLLDISKERIASELNRILLADKKYGIANGHYRGLKLLDKMDLLKYLLPSVSDCKDIPQNPKYHKYDVLEHTFMTVKNADPSVRLAALMHDTGKAYCYNLYQNTYGHEKISANFVRDELGQNGLKYSNSVVDEVARLCGNHMYDMDGKTSINKVKIFVATNIDIIDKLCMLIEADRLATGLYESDGSEHKFIKIKKQLIEEGAPLKVTDLALDGNVLMGLGFKGEDIGDLLNNMLKECLLAPRLNNIDWLTAYATKRLDGKN